MKARVTVGLKPGVLDPEGQAIASALAGLGFDRVANVRRAKVIAFDVDAPDAAAARAAVEAMCARLLANPVMETWTVEIDGQAAAGPEGSAAAS